MNRRRYESSGLSPELIAAISPFAREVEPDFPLVPEKDLPVLKQLLRGDRKPAVPVDRKRAINALVRSERSPEVRDILARILSNPIEPTEARVVAARNLPLVPGEPAEKALIANVDSSDPFVREAVISALGRTGGPAARERLEQLPEPENDRLRSQLSLAKLAIDFRTGSAASPDTSPAEALGIRWITVPAKILDREQVRQSLEHLRGMTYGITLNPEFAVHVTCPESRHILYLNESVRQGALLESVRSRKLLAGIVALQDEDAPYATVRYLLLTYPAPNGVEIIVTRTSGEANYAGTGIFEENGLRVVLRDVGPERTPVDIEAVVTNDEIRATFRVWAGRERPKKRGLPVT